MLNIVDYLQTIYAIKFFGTSIEANPIGRFLFEHNSAWAMKFIGVPLILIAIWFVIRLDAKQILAPFVLFVFYYIVVLHNFAELTKTGLLSFYIMEDHIMTTISIVCAAITTVSVTAVGALCIYYRHLKKK
jgi:hypothetical protein